MSLEDRVKRLEICLLSHVALSWGTKGIPTKDGESLTSTQVEAMRTQFAKYLGQISSELGGIFEK